MHLNKAERPLSETFETIESESNSLIECLGNNNYYNFIFNL